MSTHNSNIQAFWHLVCDHVAEIRSLISEQAALSSDFLDALQDSLSAIDPRLTVFCSPEEDLAQVNLVFGCDGYQQSIDQVLELVAGAPVIEGVKPVAFSPRANHIPDGIELNGLLVHIEEVYFSLRKVQQKLHLDIFLEDLGGDEDDLRVEAVLMFLEAIIGEYDLMTCMASIDWHDLPADPEDHGLKNLGHLRSDYDACGPLQADYGMLLH